MNKNDKKTINKPSKKVAKDPLRIEDLDKDLRDRIHVVRREFIRGLNFVRQHPRSVTFFGSARLPEENQYYQKAQEVAEALAEVGIDVLTGGGPGIMEAANRGASQTTGSETGQSLGLNITLPEEQVLNPYVEDNESFHYFFARKVALTFSAEAYLFFPGGFGTLDEFFEILTLVQTNKIVTVPIILVGSEFWKPLNTFIQETLLQEFETISHNDMDLYFITDDTEEIIDIVKNAPLRSED